MSVIRYSDIVRALELVDSMHPDYDGPPPQPKPTSRIIEIQARLHLLINRDKVPRDVLKEYVDESEDNYDRPFLTVDALIDDIKLYVMNRDNPT